MTTHFPGISSSKTYVQSGVISPAVAVVGELQEELAALAVDRHGDVGPEVIGVHELREGGHRGRLSRWTPGLKYAFVEANDPNV